MTSEGSKDTELKDKRLKSRIMEGVRAGTSLFCSDYGKDWFRRFIIGC